MRIAQITPLLAAFLFVGSVAAADSAPAAKADSGADRLATRLVGNYSNHEQARTDFNFRDVSLHVARIWPDRADGPWLYLEQTLADAPTLPYRQQIYQLIAGADGAIEVRVYKLPDPIALTGAWKDPVRFAALAPENFVACHGCSLHLKPQPDGSVKGGTEGKACASDIPNAAYASTDLAVSDHSLVLWDRGFTDKGLQIWGPPNLGYDFTRAD